MTITREQKQAVNKFIINKIDEISKLIKENCVNIDEFEVVMNRISDKINKLWYKIELYKRICALISSYVPPKYINELNTKIFRIIEEN